MNVSEYIVSYLEEKNIGRVFGVVGGAILWFCKALNESKKIKPVFTNHEQAAAMAADGWARVSGKPGVVFSINGPGMTNTITGIAQAWVDSSPVILITGNSNLKSVQYERDAEVRQYGTQDVRTDKLMESITKKHFLLENAEDVKACMEEAYHLAVTGRPGPVCIEIPINVQSAKISNSVLGEEKIFINSVNVSETNCSDINLVLEKLSIAKRPLILAGQGVRLSGTTEKFRKFVEQYQIPVANSRMGIDTIESDNQYFVGRVGNHGSRPAHFALQTCDVLLILGSRLAPNTTGYDVGKFSNQSYKILVDVDKKELDKFGITVDQKLHMDLRTFFDLVEKKTDVRSTAGQKTRERWIACCNEWKMKYPIMQSRYYHDSEISTYRVVEAVSDLAGADDLIISDTGSCCSIVAQVWQVKGNQRVFISGGLSAMGYWAMSMGVAAANQGKSNVICFAGDGSLQMNIHELATIRQYGFPIKIFIINNSGYQFVRMSQSAYGIDPPFGTDVDKGVPIPDTKKLANAYGLNYCCCDKAAGLKDVIRDVLESEEAQLCEIFVAKDQEVCPRLKSIALEDGTFVSPDYENLYPFLDAEVLEKEIKQAYVNKVEGKLCTMIFDISQEIFSSDVYPGDTIPNKKEILSLKKSNPDKCNLTEFVLGSHTGTHLDAPCHFVADGKDIEHVELDKCIGKCLVVALEEICHENVEQWRKKGICRILFKNGKKLTIQEAEYLIKAGCECVGVECNTVGVDAQNEEVHKILLLNEMVIIEGLRMEHVPEGEYFVSALPLIMKDLDGSPIRAILWKNDMEES